MYSGGAFIANGFEEIINPTIWEVETFVKKAGGSEILGQMFNFQDKGEREICLLPEVTGVIQQLVNENDFQNKYPAKSFMLINAIGMKNHKKEGIESLLKGVEFSEKIKELEM